MIIITTIIILGIYIIIIISPPNNPTSYLSRPTSFDPFAFPLLSNISNEFQLMEPRLCLSPKYSWPDAEIWVTEYAYAHQDLQTTQAFYNQTADYFEKLDYLGRYSYFGAFRSSNSNVGANAAFLNQDGKLTDIGSWYSGFGATGVNPGSDGAISFLTPGAGRVVLGVMACLLVGLL